MKLAKEKIIIIATILIDVIGSGILLLIAFIVTYKTREKIPPIKFHREEAAPVEVI